VVLQLLEGAGEDSTLPTTFLFEELLTKFQGIFEEPQGLPPIRTHDHRIVLKDNSKHMCVLTLIDTLITKKTEIEKIVWNLLKSRVIRSKPKPFFITHFSG
jgi:hypothetical protein